MTLPVTVQARVRVLVEPRWWFPFGLVSSSIGGGRWRCVVLLVAHPVWFDWTDGRIVVRVSEVPVPRFARRMFA